MAADGDRLVVAAEADATLARARARVRARARAAMMALYAGRQVRVRGGA